VRPAMPAAMRSPSTISSTLHSPCPQGDSHRGRMLPRGCRCVTGPVRLPDS
jgi:hypothetical protein